MSLVHWPTPGDLGAYYDVWLKMAIAWVVVAEYCEDQDWYLELEREARSRSMTVDGIMDMVAFIEVFYLGLSQHDWHLHCIVRASMLMF